jgi:hypothetical protein
MGRGFAERDRLTGVVRAAYGSKRGIASLERLRGGSKKGVYRLAFDDETTAILYVWNPAENYWPTVGDEASTDLADPFCEASGFDLFEASHARLGSLGVAVPRIHLMDRSKAHYPAEIALVEDVRGGTLEDLLRRDPQQAEPVLKRLSAALATMHRDHSQGIGKLTAVSSGAARQDRSCEQIVLDRALEHLDQAAARIDRVAAARSQLADVTRTLAAAVRPRVQHGLIHGELGPDHVLIDDDGQPVLIDIEGVMFFDVEWEHAFLGLRFHDHYRWLRASGLDDQRLRFYLLALHLSLIAGPLRLLDGDFPDREPVMKIIEWNTGQALSFLG